MPQQAAFCPAVSAGHQYAGDGTWVFADPFATEISGQTCQPTAAQQLCGGMCAVSEHCHGGKIKDHTLSQERVATRVTSLERSLRPCYQLRKMAKADHAGMRSDNATGVAPSPLFCMKLLISTQCIVPPTQCMQPVTQEVCRAGAKAMIGAQSLRTCCQRRKRRKPSARACTAARRRRLCA